MGLCRDGLASSSLLAEAHKTLQPSIRDPVSRQAFVRPEQVVEARPQKLGSRRKHAGRLVFGQTSHVVEPLVGATRAAAFSMRPCGCGEGLLGGFLDQMPVELLEQAETADVAFGPRDVSGVRA